MQKLNGPFKLPITKPDKLVIFLHGVGSDGYDLITLAGEFEDTMPNAVFLSPNAPFPYDEYSSGYQWFSLKDRSDAALHQQSQATIPILQNYIEENLAKYELEYQDLVLIGFSQGSMMALQLAPRLPIACAAVIGFSGALINPAALMKAAIVKPPIFLCHGMEDQVVPIMMHKHAAKALQTMQFPLQEYIIQSSGHTISSEGLEYAKEFLQKTLKA